MQLKLEVAPLVNLITILTHLEQSIVPLYNYAW